MMFRTIRTLSPVCLLLAVSACSADAEPVYTGGPQASTIDEAEAESRQQVEAAGDAVSPEGAIDQPTVDGPQADPTVSAPGQQGEEGNPAARPGEQGPGGTEPVAALGPGPLDPESSGELDPDKAPSENFDLSNWFLTLPIDVFLDVTPPVEGSDGKPDNKKESVLNAGYSHPEMFFTADDGGMVLKCPIKGVLTSSKTDFTRVELREMIRRGDLSIPTKGINKNNWVLSTAPSSDRLAAGGVDGTLRATLKVDHVTTTGDESEVGRVIIGQIHANDDEPVRLYYRLLKGHERGSIYFAHEPRNGSDRFYTLLGSRSDDAREPSNGIELGEVFSYEIRTEGNDLFVTLKRDGEPDVTQKVDMKNSGYDDGGQYLYFKAGVYNQNQSGRDDDYVQATFYDLKVTH